MKGILAGNQKRVYVHVRTGKAEDAKRIVESHYSECELVILSHREFREAGWKGQIRTLSKLKGEALVFYCQSLEEIYQPQLLVWTGLVHQCRDTVFADANGHFQVYRRVDWIRLFPKAFLSVVSDIVVLLSSWMLLQFLRRLTKPAPMPSNLADKDLDVCYLYPYPLDRSAIGGAMSHVRGFLGGLAQRNVKCDIYSGRELPSVPFQVYLIQSHWSHFLLWEPLILLYNLTFVFHVREFLRGRRVRMIYQRHGRFVIVGALLSKWIRVPLVLEYNGSEDWTAKFWDPSRFRTWLRLCEEGSLSSASLIVVVSEALRDDLLQRGIPSDRILVNPNAVDPDKFRPNCGGVSVREKLGFNDSNIVVCFIGTFSYWHGISVLRDAIRTLSTERPEIVEGRRLRFLLTGEGPLYEESRTELSALEMTGDVIFTGVVPHDQVPAYLDASDILVSPHVPMPDGRPFFGSPTKLFEYMAMSKAIIASNLDQLGQVLKHQETALLIAPGNKKELENAIVLLANNPELRFRLGRAARAVAIAKHTWQGNASRVLSRVAPQEWKASDEETGVVPGSMSHILTVASKAADD